MNERVIILTASSFNSPIWHVPKPEMNEWLLTVDYHSLNAVGPIKALISNTQFY